jgi:hypothetical protein
MSLVNRQVWLALDAIVKEQIANAVREIRCFMAALPCKHFMVPSFGLSGKKSISG